MKIIYKKLSELHPYENNPRRNDPAVASVANSIQEFGFRVPVIIDRDGCIVCGHTRYKAAKKLRMSRVPCILADDLTPEQIRAFRLADNKTAEFSEWNTDRLSVEMNELEKLDIDMTLFGFGFDTDYMEDEDDMNDGTGNGRTTEVLRCRCPKCGYRFNEEY